MAFPALFDALKLHFKAQGLTYADVAARLEISEATVKRIFSARECSVARLAQLCEVAQVELADLVRATPRGSRLLSRLTWQQEEELTADDALFLVAVCALNQMTVDDMVGTYRLERPQCLALLLRLERLGLLELHPNDRIRLCLSRTFAWLPNGPIMRRIASLAGDYFAYPFDGPGEFMRVINVRVSPAAATALVSRMEQVAREYAEQHAADATLPLAGRPVLSVCLAVRHWEPALFRRMLRPPEGAETIR